MDFAAHVILQVMLHSYAMQNLQCANGFKFIRLQNLLKS